MKILQKISFISLMFYSTLSFSNENQANKLITEIHDFLIQENKNQAEEYLNENEKIEFIIKGIGQSSKLPKCDEYSIKLNEEKINVKNTVIVSCPKQYSKWRIYIPTQKITQIKVVVMRENADKGEILMENNLAFKYKNKNRLRKSYFTSTDKLIGAKAKRNLRKDILVTRHSICMVCAKEPVIINAGLHGLSIKTSGIALSDGNIGDTIRVKNSKSGRIISGIVTNIGEIKINF